MKSSESRYSRYSPKPSTRIGLKHFWTKQLGSYTRCGRPVSGNSATTSDPSKVTCQQCGKIN